MKSDLYCICCEKTVLAETDFAGRLFHYNTVQVNNSPDPGTRYDLEECEMKEGFATCPPPEFDLNEYIFERGLPPYPIMPEQEVSEDFPPLMNLFRNGNSNPAVTKL